MGKMSRDKGARFERRVVHRLKVRYPKALIRRNRQSEGALDSDVSIRESGTWADDLWIECTHSKKPDLKRKLRQAWGDIQRLGKNAVDRFPVVFSLQTGSRIPRATFYNDLRMQRWVKRIMLRSAYAEDYDFGAVAIASLMKNPDGFPGEIVTTDLDEFIDGVLPSVGCVGDG